MQRQAKTQPRQSLLSWHKEIPFWKKDWFINPMSPLNQTPTIFDEQSSNEGIRIPKNWAFNTEDQFNWSYVRNRWDFFIATWWHWRRWEGREWGFVFWQHIWDVEHPEHLRVEDLRGGWMLQLFQITGAVKYNNIGLWFQGEGRELPL